MRAAASCPSRPPQAGARLARVMRLLRVIRVIRIFASLSKRRNPQSSTSRNQQSAVGKRLNEMLVRSMVLIVILLMIIFPLLGVEERAHSPPHYSLPHSS